MSEEEKKALETIKEELQDQKQAFKYYKGVLGVYSNGKVETLLNLVDKQQKEIEEKSTIIMAGAEKVKQLEKEIRKKEQTIKILRKTRPIEDVFHDLIKEKEYISKDKIREKIKAFQDVKKEIIKNENKLSRVSITYDIVRNDYCEKMLQELLEEN